MGSSQIERRRGRRVELQAPLLIRRAAAPSAESASEQVTGNVSLAGVYFETEEGAYRVNDLVTASVSVPETQRRGFPFTRVAGRCRVVRVSELPGTSPTGRKRFGVALEFGNDAVVLTASPPWG